MEIKRMENTKGFSCNVFICKSSKGNFIVDPGYVNEKMINYIKEIGGIDFILITHGHFDHIYGLNSLTNLFPECEVYAYKDELDVIYDPRKNCSIFFDGNRLEIEKDILPLDEGKIKIKDHLLRVIHTPGHTKGGCVYIFDDAEAVFTGDTIICESIGRYDLPTSSHASLFNSINKIKELNIPSSYKAYFGHGEIFTFEKLYRVNNYLK